MDNNKKILTFCQCLNVLNVSSYPTLLDDHRSHKLTFGIVAQLHLLAQLMQLKSYDLITEHLRANPELGKAIKLESISSSQLSRKTKSLNTVALQQMFCDLIVQIKQKTATERGSLDSVGRLHLIDATDIRLPDFLGHWARCGSRKTGVRLHVRLVVASPDTVFPDRVIASTVNVRESVVAMELTTDINVTYVMDRGYEKCKHFEKWLIDGKRFVVRVRDLLQLHPIESTRREVPDDNKLVVQDVDVTTNKSKVPMRLIEFKDEKGRHYRVVTSRWDISAAEIARIYKSRWLIELFFKWVKQHLNLIHLNSYDPTAVWNQLFLSLIAFAVSLLVKLSLNTKKSQWAVLQLLRIYMYDANEQFQKAVYRPPTKSSKGRQKKEDRIQIKQEPLREILRLND